MRRHQRRLTVYILLLGVLTCGLTVTFAQTTGDTNRTPVFRRRAEGFGSTYRSIEPRWLTNDDIARFQEWRSWRTGEPIPRDSVNWRGIDPFLARRVDSALMRAAARGMEVLEIEAFRPSDYQRYLKSAHASGREGIAATPASFSRHSTGLAFDLELADKTRLEEWLTILSSEGLYVPLPLADPNHVETAPDGGVVLRELIDFRQPSLLSDPILSAPNMGRRVGRSLSTPVTAALMRQAYNNRQQERAKRAAENQRRREEERRRQEEQRRQRDEERLRRQEQSSRSGADVDYSRHWRRETTGRRPEEPAATSAPAPPPSRVPERPPDPPQQRPVYRRVG